ncbi:MAG: hypothetical protein Q7R79_01475 [bacterium]|nr:hypothetical protein [bacterium]
MVDAKQFQMNPSPELPKIPEVPPTPSEREAPVREVPELLESEKEPPLTPSITVPAPIAPQPVFAEKSHMRREIETVLEEDIDFLYKALSQKQRQQFRIEGERTAAKIEILMKQAVIKLVEIIKLIRSWLTLLPGVDRFFIEQEAKIKAERMLLLKEPSSESSEE